MCVPLFHSAFSTINKYSRRFQFFFHAVKGGVAYYLIILITEFLWIFFADFIRGATFVFTLSRKFLNSMKNTSAALFNNCQNKFQHAIHISLFLKVVWEEEEGDITPEIFGYFI